MASLAFLSLTNSAVYTWVLLPALIFAARIVDVSLGTIRILFISRGTKYLAPLIGFIEILIWLLAIGQIMQNLSNVACYIAYAGGFATGTYVGILIEEKLAMGLQLVRVVTTKDATKLIEYLKSADFGVTHVAARGVAGEVRIVLTIIRRKNLQKVIEIIKRFNPQAFYSTEDIRFVSKEVFPLTKSPVKRGLFFSMLRQRKGK
jgi:uncharacterized protein YebE (UPF0316 family)